MFQDGKKLVGAFGKDIADINGLLVEPSPKVLPEAYRGFFVFHGSNVCMFALPTPCLNFFQRIETSFHVANFVHTNNVGRRGRGQRNTKAHYLTHLHLESH